MLKADVLALDSNTTAITHTSCIVGAGLAPALNTLALSARALESPDSASAH